MPKDEWRCGRDRDVARQAEYEIATGGLRSFEALSDEVVPLDKTNVLTSRSTTNDPDPVPPGPPRAERSRRPSPATLLSRGLLAIVRFPIARGVSVSVKIEPKSKMSIVQALEAALAEARTRRDLEPPMPPVKAAPRKAEKRNAPSPAGRPPDLPEPEIAVFRKKLKDLAETIAARSLLRPAWRKKLLGSWQRRVDQVQGPSGFARLMIVLESNLNDAKIGRGPSKARRQVWSNECRATRTFQDVGKSLARLAELLRIR
jgi:hypothetical protein